MDGTLLKRPSAIMPVAMSATALTIVLVHAALFGTARQADEGTAAHLWQVLMVAQVPIIAVFATTWVRAQPRQGLPLLALQVSAALAALFPVWWFQW